MSLRQSDEAEQNKVVVYMNKLEFHLKARHFENDPLGYLVVEANVDSQPIADFGECAIDLHQFQRSVEKEGEYFILTCWCGDPGCANIKHGINVQHALNKVQWRATIAGKAQAFEFDKEAYTAVQKNLQLQAKELLDHLKMSNDGELTIVPIRNRAFLNN